jgi:hypothetical protein
MIGVLLVVEAPMMKGHPAPVVLRLDLDRQHSLGAVGSPLTGQPGQLDPAIRFEDKEAPVVRMPAPLKVNNEEKLALRDGIGEKAARQSKPPLPARSEASVDIRGPRA